MENANYDNSLAFFSGECNALQEMRRKFNIYGPMKEILEGDGKNQNEKFYRIIERNMLTSLDGARWLCWDAGKEESAHSFNS